jgi:glycosyltransferase involved in cell wall biosynthesis
VICFLDAARYLEETLESVAAQSMPDYEVLLVDDGSTDASTEIARSWCDRDPRFRYIEHEAHANLGLSASRNAGIASAQADLIALLDADDVWMPEKLEQQMAILQSDHESAMVCGAVLYWRSWNGGTDEVRQTGDRPGPRNPGEASLSFYPIGPAHAPCPSDLMIRRDAIEQIGGFESEFKGDLAMYEDQAFLAKLYLTSRIHVSGRVWLRYRIHEGSIVAMVSRAGNARRVRAYFLAWLTRYLDTRGIEARALRQKVMRARLESASPISWWVGSWRRRLRRRLEIGIR